MAGGTVFVTFLIKGNDMKGGNMYSRYAWDKYSYHWTKGAEPGYCNFTFFWCDGDYMHGKYGREI